MERKITNDLLRWKRDENRKNLLLYGMHQIGKTYSVIDFGERFYKNIVYFDLYNNNNLIDFFRKEKITERLIFNLTVLSGESIFKEDTLIVFDNCYDVEFIKKTTILSKEDYHIIIITSNKSIVKDIKSEELRYCKMNQMDFEEFLLNSEKKQLIDFINDSYDTLKPMPFHQMALDLYNDYLITGGMPEVVNEYFNGNNFLKMESIKNKILNIYIGDIALNNIQNDYSKSIEVFNSLPYQLIKENRKFQYGLIKKGGRSKEYENAINSLNNNAFINRCFRLTDIKSPLSSFKDNESFKLYLNDTGLLFTMLHLSKFKLLTDSDIRRCLIENNVANVLNNNGISLYYYQSDGKAMVSFVVQNRIGKVIPIEVIDMNLMKAKSLSMFLSKYEIEEGIRITEDNFNKKRGIKYVPIYATFCLKNL